MPKGGARVRSGPARDPNALRRDTHGGDEWTVLPKAGREGETPDWPLRDPSGRELELWDQHWKMPQAVMWERSQLFHAVALYVRNLTAAEIAGSPANRATLVRQFMDDLGLTEGGLAKNRWRVGEPESDAKSRPRTKSASARDRLKVVQGGGS